MALNINDQEVDRLAAALADRRRYKRHRGPDPGRAAARLKYGKGRHPAALNFGDCMTFGNDFAQTDLESNGVIGHWPTPGSAQPAIAQ